jgi:PAS domain S-box-containing protein
MSCRLKKESKMNKKITAGAGLNVLALEDSVRDFEIIREQLIDAGYHLNISRVDKEKEFESSIRGNQYDIILADFKLPGFDAFGALRLCNEICPNVPFICVSGSIGEETAIELIKQGAVDYILKDRLARLPSAIKRALDEAKEKETKLMAEEALRNTEQQIRTFLDATSDMAFLKDESFRHIIVNSTLCNFYGKTESEIIGKTDFDLMPEEAAAQCRKTDEQMLRSHNLHISEEVVGDRYYETRKFPVDLAEGKKGIGAYIRDITEHKQAEEVIVRTAQEWQMTFDSANDMIWLLDSEQRVLRANKVSEKFFKRPCGDLFGMHCWDIVHGTTAPIPECPLLRAKKNLSRESMELQIGDDWFIVNVDPIIDATGQYDGAVHIVRDITERKRIEEALRESEYKYKSLIDNISDIIFTIDLEGKITFASKRTKGILGYESAETINMNIFDFIPEEDRQRAIENLQKGMKGEKIKHFQIPMITKSGERLFFECSFSRVYKNGVVVGAQGTAVDITERKKAESQRKAALEEIRKLNENLEQLIKERTAELQENIDLLEETNRAFVGRELRMIELKERIAELEKQKT